MTAELLLLGGAEEIGANSCYLNLDGTGIIIDAGLHPKDRTAAAFPDIDALALRPTDALLITHAHTDHMGALPYVMRRLPHLRTMMTHATRDLSHIMLHNGAKLLKTDIRAWFSDQALEFYKRDTIELLRHAFEAVPYDEPFLLRGYDGGSDVAITYHWSGHILGSASITLECCGMRIMHTGDIQFDDQIIIPKARVPRKHVDVLITEATNAAVDRPNDYKGEAKRLAAFVNRITNANGSVLIPSFALGKTQETLGVLHSLMQKGSIPRIPIFTVGMGVRINKIYDQYCYSDPMRVPGFEVSDIPQERIHFDTLFNGPYMKHPSIVVAPSGMMNKGTVSFALATAFMRKPNFGIAFIGYQDPESPGYELLHSQPDKAFMFAGKETRRSCQIERLRFSAHASLDGLLGLITDIRPTTLVIMHGEPDACDMLALCTRERLPGTRVIIPRQARPYMLGEPASTSAPSLGSMDPDALWS